MGHIAGLYSVASFISSALGWDFCFLVLRVQDLRHPREGSSLALSKVWFPISQLEYWNQSPHDIGKTFPWMAPREHVSICAHTCALGHLKPALPSKQGRNKLCKPHTPVQSGYFVSSCCQSFVSENKGLLQLPFGPEGSHILTAPGNQVFSDPTLP